MNENPVITVETAHSTDTGVWDARSTLWFGLGIGMASLVVQVLALGLFFRVSIASNPEYSTLDVSAIAEKSAFVSALAVIGLVLLVIRLRKGVTVREYLGLRSISLKVMLTSLLSVVIFAVICDGISYLCGRPIVSASAIYTYRTCTTPLFLWFSAIVAVPISEEVLYRGFLLKGFKGMESGIAGAVIVSALLYALAHIQYDLFDIGIFFVMGILLGVVRFKSRSLWTCIAMNSLVSLIAMMEVVLNVRAAG